MRRNVGAFQLLGIHPLHVGKYSDVCQLLVQCAALPWRSAASLNQCSLPLCIALLQGKLLPMSGNIDWACKRESGTLPLRP